MNGRIIGALAITAAAFLCNTASGTTTKYLGCDGCTSAQMMQTALIGPGRFIVGDIINKQVGAYIVKSVQHGGADPTLAISADVLAPQEITSFNSLVSYYNDAPVGYQKVFNIIIDPSTGASVAARPVTMAIPEPGGGHVTYPYGDISAYDIIDPSPAQNQFLQWLTTENAFDIERAMNDLESTLSQIHIFDASHMPGLSWTVTFQDGSTIGVFVDNTQQPPQITINYATAVDSHGNQIPVNAAAIAAGGRKIYNYSGAGTGGDIARMRQRLSYFGVTPPATVEWACVWVEGLGTHCSPAP